MLPSWESISQSYVSSGSSIVGLMVTSSKRNYAIPTPARASVPAANYCRPVPPQETLSVQDTINERNINNLRYLDDSTLMAESKEEPKSLSSKVKEESERVGLKLNIQKTNITASGPITSWQIDSETMETSDRLYFLGLQNHCRWWLQPWN